MPSYTGLGFIGLAAGVIAWCKQVMSRVGVQIPTDLLSKMENLPLAEHIRALLQLASTFAGRRPQLVIIGPHGRVGARAVELSKQLELEAILWTRKETAGQGPFAELLHYDILVNAINVTVPLLR
jgi:hypothetical protein